MNYQYPSAVPCPQCGKLRTYVWEKQIELYHGSVMGIGKQPCLRCDDCKYVGPCRIPREKGKPGRPPT